MPVELGFVNVANGNLHMEIPLAGPAQRGSLQVGERLVYDSRIWKIDDTGTWSPTNVPNAQLGWRFLSGAESGAAAQIGVSHRCDTINPTTYTVFTGFTWTQPDGTVRNFSPILTERDPNLCDTGNIPNSDALADDGSGYHMYVTNFTSKRVVAPDGTQVYPTWQDANGNSFSTDGNGNLIDTLGRTPVAKSSDASHNYYDILTSKGTTQRVTVNLNTYIVGTAFNQSGILEYSASLTAPASVQLPDGSIYQFGYDSYGELTSVTLPTGGTVSYAYNNFTDAYGNINRWINTRDSGGGHWVYSGPTVLPVSNCQAGSQQCQQVTVTKPSLDTTIYTFSMNNGAWNSLAQYNDHVSGSTLATINTTYDLSQVCNGCSGAGYVRAVTTTTTLSTVGGGSLTKQTQYSYDNPMYGNVTDIKQWNFYTGSPSPTPDRETVLAYSSSDPTYVAKNILNRPTDVITRQSGVQIAETKYVLDTATSLMSVTGIQNHDDTNFGTGNTSRGNVTQIQQWNGSAFINTATLTYDTTGQLQQSLDVTGANPTTFSYSDSFYNDNGANPPAAIAPPLPTNAYLTSVNLPIIGTQTIAYYLGSGNVAFATDQNNARTYSHYVDSLDRISQVSDAGGGWALFTYASQTQQDSYLSLTDTTPATTCTSCRHDQILLDSLGRMQQSIVVSDPDGQVKVDTTYDANSRVNSASNPYRSASDSTYGLTGMSYDGLDRVIKITEPDNGQPDNNVITTAYGPTAGSAAQLCGNGLGYPSVTTDEAGKKRQLWSDGFDRLIEVDEPDSAGNFTIATCYQYNASTASTQVVVTQRGGDPNSADWRVRTFNYDALGRLTTATTPESGTTSYFYTTAAGGFCAGAQSLVCRRTDARGITTTYSYDALNRITGKNYSDGTAVVTYSYDQSSYNGLTITNGKGRRTGMSDGSGQTAWSYDVMGRVLTKRQTIAPAGSGLTSMTNNISYTYNLDGSVATMTYPSGRTITYGYNNALQATSLVDNATSIYRNFVTNAHYAAPGALASATHGDGITDSNSFNKRVQPVSFLTTSSTQTLLSYSYSYDQSGHNNGSVVQMINNLTGTRNPGNNRSLAFTYDQLNRLQTAGTIAGAGTPWSTTYSYDAWGNLYQKSTTGPGEPSVGPLTVDVHNRLNTAAYTYDAAGNLTFDGKDHLNFDAENQVHPVSGLQYYYDGDGHRVAKSDGSRWWYDDAFNAISSADVSNTIKRDFIFFNGARIAYVSVSSGDSHYFLTDHLGSPHVIANGSGSVVSWEADYFPYGGEIPISNADNLSLLYLFTGYAYDSETGDYYADFREQSSTLGRFFSPDPVSGDPTDPQSWNMYSYVENDPINGTDPFGLCDPNSKDYDTCVEKHPSDLPRLGGQNCNIEGMPAPCSLAWNILSAGAGYPSELTPARGKYAGCYWGPNEELICPTFAPLRRLSSTLQSPSKDEVPQNPCNHAGRNPDPSAWAAIGAATKNNPLTTTYDFYKGFSIGGYLDAQPLASGNAIERAAYGNYVFGAYMSAAGFPLSVTLAGADAIAYKHKLSNPEQYKARAMDPTYGSLPAANVANITAGYNAQRNGTLCHK